MALTASDADSRFTVDHSSANASASSTSPNTSAPSGFTSPWGSGRRAVRRITWSRSRSIQQLMVLAPPAAKAPPTSTSITSSTGGKWPWARIIAGSVVTSRSSMTRGLVSCTYDHVVASARWCHRASTAPEESVRATTRIYLCPFRHLAAGASGSEPGIPARSERPIEAGPGSRWSGLTPEGGDDLAAGVVGVVGRQRRLIRRVEADVGHQRLPLRQLVAAFVGRAGDAVSLDELVVGVFERGMAAGRVVGG